MKKIQFLLLIIIFPFILMGQDKIDFQSEKFSFSYPDTYTISDRRILEDISVKLISNTVSRDGGKDQIGINLNSMYSSLNEIERESVISGLRDEIEIGGKKMGINVEFTLLSYEFQTIEEKEIIVITSKTEFPEYNVVQNQMMYIHVKNKKSCFMSVTSGTLKELNEREKDMNYILKTLVIHRQ